MRQVVARSAGKTSRGSALVPKAHLGSRQVDREHSVWTGSHIHKKRATKKLVSLETLCPIVKENCSFKCVGMELPRSFQNYCHPKYLSWEFG